VANSQGVGVQEAREVLRDALPQLSEAAGTEVTGDIGDLEPAIAIKDALERATTTRSSSRPCRSASLAG
jgi:hypothetical protein